MIQRGIVMSCGIGKIWETGVIRQKEKSPNRERKERQYGRLLEEDDSITISEEARDRWASIPTDENDTAS